jgi:hypothetical protein
MPLFLFAVYQKGRKDNLTGFEQNALKSVIITIVSEAARERG